MHFHYHLEEHPAPLESHSFHRLRAGEVFRDISGEVLVVGRVIIGPDGISLLLWSHGPGRWFWKLIPGSDVWNEPPYNWSFVGRVNRADLVFSEIPLVALCPEDTIVGAASGKIYSIGETSSWNDFTEAGYLNTIRPIDTSGLGQHLAVFGMSSSRTLEQLGFLLREAASNPWLGVKSWDIWTSQLKANQQTGVEEPCSENITTKEIQPFDLVTINGSEIRVVRIETPCPECKTDYRIYFRDGGTRCLRADEAVVRIRRTKLKASWHPSRKTPEDMTYADLRPGDQILRGSQLLTVTDSIRYQPRNGLFFVHYRSSAGSDGHLHFDSARIVQRVAASSGCAVVTTVERPIPTSVDGLVEVYRHRLVQNRIQVENAPVSFTVENEVYASNLRALSVIRQLGELFNSNISSLNVWTFFGLTTPTSSAALTGLRFELDYDKIQERFLEIRETLTPQPAALTVLTPEVEESISSTQTLAYQNYLQSIESRRACSLEDWKENSKAAENSAFLYRKATQEYNATVAGGLKAFSGLVLDELRDVASNGFWCDFAPDPEVDQVIWARTSRRLVLSQRNDAIGINLAVDLGYLAARVDLNTATIRVFPFSENLLSPVMSGGGGGLYHPHVQRLEANDRIVSGEVCFGTAKEAVDEAFATRRFGRVLNLAAVVLSTYSTTQPYVTLSTLASGDPTKVVDWTFEDSPDWSRHPLIRDSENHRSGRLVYQQVTPQQATPQLQSTSQPAAVSEEPLIPSGTEPLIVAQAPEPGSLEALAESLVPSDAVPLWAQNQEIPLVIHDDDPEPEESEELLEEVSEESDEEYSTDY